LAQTESFRGKAFLREAFPHLIEIKRWENFTKQGASLFVTFGIFDDRSRY